MAVHLVAARDELYESEASEASVFCFVKTALCFVFVLFCQYFPMLKSLASLSIRSFLFRYAYELLCFWMPPEESENIKPFACKGK